jgi:hypothetical protein
MREESEEGESETEVETRQREEDLLNIFLNCISY